MTESALRADSTLYPTQVKSSLLIILISCGKGHKRDPSDKICLSCGWEDMTGQRKRATITGNSKLKKQYLPSVKALTTET